MDGIAEEGWFTDPYGHHEARWMSAGVPTGLVRDGAVESTDPPPDGPPASVPVRIQAESPGGTAGADLQRADDAERAGPPDPHASTDAAEAAVDGTAGF
jgi:hypothetical protein